jgi:hypothetical protein
MAIIFVKNPCAKVVQLWKDFFALYVLITSSGSDHFTGQQIFEKIKCG